MSLLTAIELLEARYTQATAQKQKRALEKQLNPAMVAGFNAQKDAFLKQFKTLESDFSEAISDWLNIWLSVASDTEALFVEPLNTAMETALYRGGLFQVGALNIGVDFKLTNTRAVAYLDNLAAKQVTGINETTRGYINTIISNGVEQGQSYTDIAKAIGRRFDEFTGKVRAAKHIRSRAELVTITEIGNAFSEGNRIVAKDLEDEGIEMTKRWLTRGDDRVSQGCIENQNAGWIGLDELYPSGDQRPLRFPGCRCDELYERKK